MKSQYFLIGTGSVLLLAAAGLTLTHRSSENVASGHVLAHEASRMISVSGKYKLPVRNARVRHRLEKPERKPSLPQTAEAGMPLPGPFEHIYSFDSVPDLPGTYWVQEANGQVARYSVCHMES